MSEVPTGPLQGIRVIDPTTVMLGPFCTQMLGDMGADVIKIEAPFGDIGRLTGAAKRRGMSAAHLAKGRNKRSVALDLKHQDGHAVLARLVESADVFVHNIRPQAARRLRIDYDHIAAIKPDIVYASATGFGEDGPYVDKPAYDDSDSRRLRPGVADGSSNRHAAICAECVGGQDHRPVSHLFDCHGTGAQRANGRRPETPRADVRSVYELCHERAYARPDV